LIQALQEMLKDLIVMIPHANVSSPKQINQTDFNFNQLEPWSILNNRNNFVTIVVIEQT
jgi:hypothetical protein